jgi:hypothetical protein
MKFQFLKITTIYESHIDHIWTNASTPKCMLGIVKTYCIDHKPIYFAFKFPNHISQYHHIYILKNIDNNRKAKIMKRGP